MRRLSLHGPRMVFIGPKACAGLAGRSTECRLLKVGRRSGYRRLQRSGSPTDASSHRKFVTPKGFKVSRQTGRRRQSTTGGGETAPGGNSLATRSVYLWPAGLDVALRDRPRLARDSRNCAPVTAGQLQRGGTKRDASRLATSRRGRSGISTSRSRTIYDTNPNYSP